MRTITVKLSEVDNLVFRKLDSVAPTRKYELFINNGDGMVLCVGDMKLYRSVVHGTIFKDYGMFHKDRALISRSFYTMEGLV